MDEKVVEVLSGIAYYEPDHHFGRPFLTANQLAVLVKAMHTETFRLFGHPIGGRGSRGCYSFTCYLAGQLSQKVRNRAIPSNGWVLSNQHLVGIEFDDAGVPITSSSTNSQFDPSMFRYIG